MPSKSPVLLPEVQRLLQKVGEQIRRTRLQRDLTSEMIAKRAGMSRVTLSKIEKGDPNVTFGSYCSVLHSLGLDSDIGLIAANGISNHIKDESAHYFRQRASGRRSRTKLNKNDPHDLSEEKTLMIHRAIASKIKSDPEKCIVRAIANIQRWNQQSGEGNRANDEWLFILNNWSPEEIIRLITSSSEEAYRLRSSSPFVGILTQAERKQIRDEVSA
jgi:transcriptional regulator with XRE-family HTH domain